MTPQNNPRVEIDKDIYDAIVDVAIRNDVTKSAVIRACLKGVMTRGLADKFVNDYGEGSRRRGRVRRTWTSHRRRDGNVNAYDWRYRAFFLTFVGNPKDHRGSNGWTLYGPGIPPEGKGMGKRRPKAQEDAEVYIVAWEQKIGNADGP